MSYQVLARKWRPQRFDEVVGQSHVLTAISNGLAMGRLHHAYLFSGTRGVGKTSIARLLAKGLNCEKQITSEPCGICSNCREIEQGRFVDLIEIDAASRTKVEDTRELLDNVQYAPVRGRYKVYLIDEVHMLSRHSFNALLKTLEEPPEHVKFLLATTDPQKLPPTVLSRCLQFHLKALDLQQISDQLEKILRVEQVEFEAKVLMLIARAAQGSMRDALSLTDQAIALGKGIVSAAVVSRMLGLLNIEQPLSLLEALVSGNGEAVMQQVALAASQGVEWETILVELLSLLHQIAMLQLLPVRTEQQIKKGEPRLQVLARAILPADLQLYYQIILIGRKELAYAPDRRMGVEMTLMRALAFRPQGAEHATTAVLSSSHSSIQPTAPISSHGSSVHLTEKGDVTAQSPYLPQVDHKVTPLESLSSSHSVSQATEQLLQARRLLQQSKKEETDVKKNEGSVLGGGIPTPTREILDNIRVAEVLATEPVSALTEEPQESDTEEPYRWKSNSQQHILTSSSTETLTTPSALRHALEDEKDPQLLEKVIAETLLRDPWSAELQALEIPRMVRQLALNTFKEQTADNVICLHLRSKQRYLNSSAAQETLRVAMEKHFNKSIDLTLIEDDNPALLTPLEWRQRIYQEKLAQARQSIVSDQHLQKLCQLFDAEVDESSIRPI